MEHNAHLPRMFLAPDLNREAFQDYLSAVRLFQAKDQSSERAFPLAAFADKPYGRAFGQCEVHAPEDRLPFFLPKASWYRVTFEDIADFKQRRFPICYRHCITLSKALDNVDLVSTR